MAVSHAYPGIRSSNTLSLPGVVRSDYGTTNLGFASNSSFGAQHGEIFDGPQDEKMGVANYVPVIQNMCVKYKPTKKKVIMQGELVPLWSEPPDSTASNPNFSALRKVHAAAWACFPGASTPPKAGAAGTTGTPSMILPLASDFEFVGRLDEEQKGFAAFAVQAVADVIVPAKNPDIQAYPGDKLFVRYNSTNNQPELDTKRKTDEYLFLGVAVLGFDTKNGDRHIKVCM